MTSSAEQVKLDSSVVEQLVMAAVASLPTPLQDFQQAVQAQVMAQTINQTSLFPTYHDPNNRYKNELITQKVRQENRERKKRWRQQNQERNKDNDLRCRVNKRAHKLFGKEESPHKQKWIDEEFNRRRAKRMNKEERKNNTQELNGILSDPNGYISMLANKFTSVENQVKPEQFTTQLLEFLEHQQQQQTLETPSPLPPVVITETPAADTTVDKPIEYPMDAVLTLMQLNAGWRQ